MNVTRTIMRIGKCRDLIAGNDYNKISNNLIFFDELVKELHRHCQKFLRYETYELDFTPYDLQELSDEIYEYIKDFQQEMKFEHIFKEIMKNERINNQVFDDFADKYLKKMLVDEKLRNAYKQLSYYALSILLWQEARKAGKTEKKNDN